MKGGRGAAGTRNAQERPILGGGGGSKLISTSDLLHISFFYERARVVAAYPTANGWGGYW